MEADGWIGDAAQTVWLGGKPVCLEGDPDDLYFQTVAGRAVELASLAALLLAEHEAGRLAADCAAIDVGANIGLSTIILAQHFAQVIAFEPSPRTGFWLRRNLERNGVENVTVMPVAVSDRKGTLRFHEAAFAAGSHVVAPGHLAQGRVGTIDVRSAPLDSLKLPRTGFLKIDTEGHEPEVIAGARDLIVRDQPLMFAEVNVWCLTGCAGHSPGAFVRALFRCFDVWSPLADGTLEAVHDPYGFLCNVIAKHGGLVDVALRLKPGARVPDLRELSWPPAARAQLRAAERWSLAPVLGWLGMKQADMC